MRNHTLWLWPCTFIFCIANSAIAASIKNTPLIRVETETREGAPPPVLKTLTEGGRLLQGDFNIEAMVQLPLEDQRYVDDRLPLELGDVREDGGATLSMPPSSGYSRTLESKLVTANFVSKPNLLDEDELWLTYRPTSGSRQCELGIDIEVQGVPYDSSSPATNVSLKLFNRSSDQSSKIALNGVKVLPRDKPYLVKRATGIGNDPDWRVVEESNRQIFMRLMRVDLRDIDSVELEMDGAVKFVNFRLKRGETGKPTDVLPWDAIPKHVVEFRGRRLVRLELAKAIRQQMPGVLEAKTPVSLVELIAFVPKDAEPIPTGEAPIRYLKANYAESISGSDKGSFNLPAVTERVDQNTWRRRVSLDALQDTKFREVQFLHGRVAPKTVGCVATFERAEFVSLAKRKIPVILADIQGSARTLGGPFGLDREGADEIEFPKFLAHLPLNLFSKDREASSALAPGGRQVWAGMGLSVTSRSALPLAVFLDAGGLHLKGSGDVELSWASASSVPDHAYLSVRSDDVADSLHETRVRLRFSDGHSETLPYSLGDALSLRRYAGRRLVGADLLLHLPDTNGAVSISEMAVFTVKVVNAEQALKETLIADRMLDAYRVKLGHIEYAPKQPTEGFWRDLAKGQAWLDYGDVHWGGGEAIPVLSSLNPMLGMVNEWRFVYRGGADARLQAWLTESPATGATTGNPYQRWLKLGLFILLVAGSVIFWRRGRLQHIAAFIRSNLLQILYRSSLLGQALAHGLWNFLVTQRQVINMLAVLMLWVAALFYYALCSLDPSVDKLPSALIVITLFAGLNIWRWHLQDETSNPYNFLRRWIVSKSVWPPRIIWLVAVITLAFILLGMVNDLFLAVDVKDFTQTLSDISLGSRLALLVISILMDTKRLIVWVPMLLAVLYGLAPWLGAWIYRLTMPSARLARWLIIVIWLYAIGLTHIGQPGENYYFTFGGMVVVVIWYIWMERMRGNLQRRWPTLAEKIYGGAGSIYFSGALVGLAITALLLIPRLELLAEQLAVIVYFCLVVGTVKEIVSLRRTQSSRTDSPRQPDSPA